MTLRIRLFAHMARGRPGFTLEVPEGLTLADLPALLRRELPEVPWLEKTLLAVNQEYVPPTQVLHDHDEIAIIPPVSGG